MNTYIYASHNLAINSRNQRQQQQIKTEYTEKTTEYYSTILYNHLIITRLL